MNCILAFLLGTAVMTMAQLPPSTLNPVAAVTQPAQGGTSYRSVLQSAYTAILSLDSKAESITLAHVARLRTLFSSLVPGPERDAALRFIRVAEKVAILTTETRKRSQRPMPERSAFDAGTEGERAFKGATDTANFFKRGALTDWRIAMKDLAAAATAEWARIPDAAASPLLAGFTAAQVKSEKERALVKTAEELFIRVMQVTKGGVLAVPYEDYAIGGRMARIGGGGGVARGWRAGSKTIFITGLPNAAEGQDFNVRAYRDNTHTYTDVQGASRTVENWVFLQFIKQ